MWGGIHSRELKDLRKTIFEELVVRPAYPNVSNFTCLSILIM